MAAPPWSRSASCVQGKTPLVGQAMNMELCQASPYLPDTRPQSRLILPKVPKFLQQTLSQSHIWGPGVGPRYGLKSILPSLLCFRDFEQHHQILQCKLPPVVAGMVELIPSWELGDLGSRVISGRLWELRGPSDPTWPLSFHHWEHLPYLHLNGSSEPSLKPWVGESFKWYLPPLILSMLLGSYTLLYNR